MEKPDVSVVLNADHLEELEAEVLENPFLTMAEAMAELPGLTLADAVTALRRIAYHNQCKAELRAEADAMTAPLLAQIDQIRAWLTEQAADIDRRIGIHESRLQAYYRLHPPAGEVKTLKLPCGTISCKSPARKWIWDAKADLVAVVKSVKPELVHSETVESVNKNELKAAANLKLVPGKAVLVDADGTPVELPVILEDPPDEYTVTARGK